MDRNSDTVRSIRHFVFWVIMATGLQAGLRTNSSGGTSPFTRTLRPVTVSPWANTSISFIKAVFPEPVGPTIDTVSPGAMSIGSKSSGLPSLVLPGQTVIVILPERRMPSSPIPFI